MSERLYCDDFPVVCCDSCHEDGEDVNMATEWLMVCCAVHKLLDREGVDIDDEDAVRAFVARAGAAVKGDPPT